jgi:hypothetical protein
VRLDRSQGFNVMNEREDVAHRASQTNNPFVPIFLLQEHLDEKFSSISLYPDMEKDKNLVRS